MQIDLIRSNSVIIFLFIALGLTVGFKCELGSFMVEQIDKYIDHLDNEEAHTWDNVYKPYKQIWINDRLVGKKSDEILKLKGKPDFKHRQKHPWAMPESDEQWRYSIDNRIHIFYFKEGNCIAVNRNSGVIIFGGANFYYDYQRKYLIELETLIERSCGLDSDSKREYSPQHFINCWFAS